MLIISPGTKTAASSSFHFPSLKTFITNKINNLNILNRKWFCMLKEIMVSCLIAKIQGKIVILLYMLLKMLKNIWHHILNFINVSHWHYAYSFTCQLIMGKSYFPPSLPLECIDQTCYMLLHQIQVFWILMLYLGFWSETSHEGCSCIACIVLLYKTYCWVYHKQRNDTYKILPIRGLPLHETIDTVSEI